MSNLLGRQPAWKAKISAGPSINEKYTHVGTVTIDIHVSNEVESRNPIEFLPVTEDMDCVIESNSRRKLGKRLLIGSKSSLIDAIDIDRWVGGKIYVGAGLSAQRPHPWPEWRRQGDRSSCRCEGIDGEFHR